MGLEYLEIVFFKRLLQLFSNKNVNAVYIYKVRVNDGAKTINLIITNSKLGWNICQAMCRVYAGLPCTYILITKNKSFTLIDIRMNVALSFPIQYLWNWNIEAIGML